MYLGHVLRIKDCRLPKIMLHADIALGQRLSGGQELSYRTCIRRDLELFEFDNSLSFSGLEALAQDRKQWQKKVISIR